MKDNKEVALEETTKDAMSNQEKEVLELKEQVEELNKKISKKKKKKVGRIIGDVIFTVVFLLILFEAVIGIINMKKINNNEEPVWCISHKKIEDDKKIVNDYNLGLYRIVKTETEKETRTVLKLFFIDE